MDLEEQNGYEKFEERLRTFSYWPKESPALIKELVDAGFFYSGESDLVTCFACGIQIGDWHEGDNPLEKHESTNEKCKYLAERSIRKAELQSLHSESVSSSENSPDSEECDDFGLDYSEKRKSSIRKLEPALAEEDVQAIAESGLFYNETSEVFECYNCHTQFDVREILSSDDLIACHREKKSSCKHIAILVGYQECNNATEPVVKPRESSAHPKESTSKSESKPTGSDQPSGSSQQREILHCAQNNGAKPRQYPKENRLKLMMPNNVNRAQTNNRHLFTAGETPQFSPEISHGYACAMPAPAAFQKYFDPQSGSSPSGGSSPAIRVSPRVLTGSEVLTFGPQFSRQLSNWSVSSDEEIANLELHPQPQSQLSNRKKMLKTKYGRLQTFLTWPTDAKVHPQQLSEAGFYYVGEDDSVKCYLCEIVLRNWEQGDTAWNEHKRWNPSCPLVVEHFSQAARNDRQIGNLENSQPPMMRQQPERVQHNFYDMGMQMPPDVQYSMVMQSAPFRQFDSRFPEHSNPLNGFPAMGFNNIFHPPFLNSNPLLPAQQELIPSEPLPFNESSSYNENRSTKETQEVEQIGPLAQIEFDKLLDAGFSVEVINKVQKLAHEKYGDYFDKVETVADAIVHFLDNGNLDEHTIPNTSSMMGGRNGESSGITSSKKVDLKRELDKMREMQLCKICMDEQVGVAFHPCGHLFTCPRCSEGLEQCPVCRANIESTSRVYLS